MGGEYNLMLLVCGVGGVEGLEVVGCRSTVWGRGFEVYFEFFRLCRFYVFLAIRMEFGV